MQLYSTQLNSTQLNSTQLNSTQLNSTQLNSTQLNSTCTPFKQSFSKRQFFPSFPSFFIQLFQPSHLFTVYRFSWWFPFIKPA